MDPKDIPITARIVIKLEDFHVHDIEEAGNFLPVGAVPNDQVGRRRGLWVWLQFARDEKIYNAVLSVHDLSGLGDLAELSNQVARFQDEHHVQVRALLITFDDRDWKIKAAGGTRDAARIIDENHVCHHGRRIT